MECTSSSAGARQLLLAHSVSLNLFAATRFPELLISLLLSNLLSPNLHDLTRYLDPREHGGELRSLHRLLQKRFFHPLQRDFGVIWGLQEREGLHDPEELAACDYAMEMIRRGFRHVPAEHPWLQVMLELLDQGLFPRYTYPLIELVKAQKELVPTRNKQALGITCCLDECLIIAALALAAGYCRLEDIVLAGSPFHYTLFLFPEGKAGGWFNARRDLFDAETFRPLSPQQSEELFYGTIYQCDRIITSRGHCLLRSESATITPAAMGEVAARIAGLLGVLPEPIREAVRIAGNAGGEGYAGVEPLSALRGYAPEQLEAALRQAAAAGAVVAEAALYSFRHPEVTDLEPYRLAALRGFRSYIRAGEIFSVEEAVECAARIEGSKSILGEGSGRFALPDEVLAFNTASVGERALLAYTLVQHSPKLSEAEKAAITIGWKKGEWRIGGFNLEKAVHH